MLHRLGLGTADGLITMRRARWNTSKATERSEMVCGQHFGFNSTTDEASLSLCEAPKLMVLDHRDLYQLDQELLRYSVNTYDE